MLSPSELRRKRDREYYAKNAEKKCVRQRAYRIENKEAIAEASRERYIANRESVLEWHREYREANRQLLRDKELKRKHGLSRGDLGTLCEEQGGVCKICGMKRRLVVDHCHDSGAIRGLLCTGCNVGLGMFRDSPKILRDAISYLKNN